MTEKHKQHLKRGAMQIGIGLAITLIVGAAGAVWTASEAINKVSSLAATTAAKEAEHEAQDIRESSQLNTNVSKVQDEIVLLLRSQGITESQISAITSKQ